MCSFLCGCACISFSDLLAYGYAVMMLNVLRSDITIKNLIEDGTLTPWSTEAFETGSHWSSSGIGGKA